MFRFFYVKSGEYEKRILSGSERSAALKFISDLLIERHSGGEVKLGKIVIVDRRPITEEESPTAIFESTAELAAELGIEIEEEEDGN